MLERVEKFVTLVHKPSLYVVRAETPGKIIASQFIPPEAGDAVRTATVRCGSCHPDPENKS